MTNVSEYWHRYRAWLDEANERPANRAAALWFIGGNCFVLLLVLPIGQWIGPAWAGRIIYTATAVLVYSAFHSMYKLERAGGLENWEAQFDEY